MSLRRSALLGMSFLVVAALLAPAGAAGSFGKKFDKQVKKKLSKAGTINATGNPVDWTRLKGVPGGFADGIDGGLTNVDSCAVGEAIRAIDNDGSVECEPDDVGEPGSGDISAVTAGTGLTGGGTGGDVTLAVNTGVVQTRVGSNCAVGSSIRAIAADGTVTCQTDGLGLEPVAYGTIAGSNGTALSGSGNFTSEWDPVNDVWRVTITGWDNYLSTVLITPKCLGTAAIAKTATPPVLLIELMDIQTGTRVQCLSEEFSFVVYP